MTTQSIDYTNWTNMTSLFRRGYTAGDRLVRGWQGTVEVDDEVGVTRDDDGKMVLFNPVKVFVAAAEILFMRHNRDDRPDGQMCPSMSVGDLAELDDVALTCQSSGWEFVRLDGAELIVDRTWSAVIRESRAVLGERDL